MECRRAEKEKTNATENQVQGRRAKGRTRRRLLRRRARRHRGAAFVVRLLLQPAPASVAQHSKIAGRRLRPRLQGCRGAKLMGRSVSYPSEALVVTFADNSGESCGECKGA